MHLAASGGSDAGSSAALRAWSRTPPCCSALQDKVRVSGAGNQWEIPASPPVR
jgi:hypothetical protein